MVNNFNTKKTAFINELKKEDERGKTRTVKELEEEIKNAVSDPKNSAIIDIDIENMISNKVLDKESETRIYAGTYNIKINITVERYVNTEKIKAKQWTEFVYDIPTKDIGIDVNKGLKQEVDYITTNEKFESGNIDFFKWEDFNIDPKFASNFYLSITVEYEVEFKGIITKDKIEKTETVEAHNFSYPTIECYELKTPNNEEVYVGVLIKLFPNGAKNHDFYFKTHMRAIKDLKDNGKQSITVNVKKITLHAKK